MSGSSMMIKLSPFQPTLYRQLTVALLFIMCGSLAAQSSGAESPAAVSRQPGAPGSYVLGPGDQILVRAANAPELNEKSIRLDLGGLINLPIVGRIQAGGTTVEDLEGELKKRLKVFLEEPDVSVTVSEYQSQPVSVFGEVGNPGVHQLQGRKSLIEMLAVTGGVRPGAGPVAMITRRLQYGRIPLPGAKDDATGKFSIAQVELRPLVQARTPENDISIQPYDIISIPKAESIYIAGEVVRSGLLALSDKPTLTIVEALSISGGLTKAADGKRGRILRATKPGAIRPQESVDIAGIMRGRTDDVLLNAGDILVVPSSVTKKATQRAIEIAIQIGTVILSAGLVSGSL